MRISRLFRAPKHTFSAPLAPEVPFYAMGDLHGRDDLLQTLLDRLYAIADPEARLVCVGDYIDRGEESAQVLRRLYALQADAGEDVMICLCGNHEQMMLNFLDDPAGSGPRWMRYGGLQTLASFRIQAVPATAPEAQWRDARDRLRDAMGTALERWLRALPMVWQTGNVAVVHAAADPALPIAEQASQTLLWGHPDFEDQPRQDSVWVVHGHTIVDAVTPREGRLCVDTGAYATGRLSAALLRPDGADIEVIST